MTREDTKEVRNAGAVDFKKVNMKSKTELFTDNMLASMFVHEPAKISQRMRPCATPLVMHGRRNPSSMRKFR